MFVRELSGVCSQAELDPRDADPRADGVGEATLLGGNPLPAGDTDSFDLGVLTGVSAGFLAKNDIIVACFGGAIVLSSDFVDRWKVGSSHSRVIRVNHVTLIMGAVATAAIF